MTSISERPPVGWRDPHGTEDDGWSGELWLATFFLSAAGLLLAFLNPIHVSYRPHLVETLLLAAVGVGLSARGIVRDKLTMMLAGAGVLLATIALGLLTQPVQLGVPFNVVWPLRAGLFLLVLGAWAFLLRPPAWARRALIAVSLPTLLLLLCAGGTGIATSLTQGVLSPAANFPPYWLAFDSQDNLYATAADGNYVWVFSPAGAPRSTLWPPLAPRSGTPGPGFVPAGFPTPSVITTTAALQGATTSSGANCGIAVDQHDRVYLIDPITQELTQYDTNGNITARVAMPEGFEGARDCLDADSSYIYAGSRFGRVYVLTHDGEVVRSIATEFQPFGLEPDGHGSAYVLGANLLLKIEASTGMTSTIALPQVEEQLVVPYQAMIITESGEFIGTDIARNRMVRILLDGLKPLGTMGSAGVWPGQFGGMGGLAEDSSGRIYAADWQYGVIQRFGSNGQVDAVWSAPGAPPRPPQGEGEEE